MPNPLSSEPMDRGPVSPFTMHPVFMSDGESSNAPQGPWPVDKPKEANYLAGTLAASSPAQDCAGSPQQRRASGLFKSVPEASLSSLKIPRSLDCNERSTDLETAPARNKGYGAFNSSQEGMTVPSGLVDPKEIENRVIAMLAATDALKPKNPLPKISSETKMPHKVLAKVSNA